MSLNKNKINNSWRPDLQLLPWHHHSHVLNIKLSSSVLAITINELKTRTSFSVKTKSRIYKALWDSLTLSHESPCCKDKQQEYVEDISQVQVCKQNKRSKTEKLCKFLFQRTTKNKQTHKKPCRPASWFTPLLYYYPLSALHCISQLVCTKIT